MFIFSDCMSTSKLSGCSGSSFTASRMVLLAMAKLPSPSTSVMSNVVMSVFSLSDAVMVSLSFCTLKRKQSNIGNEFLLFITWARACRRLLSAVLETLNLIIILFYFCSTRIWVQKYKNTLFKAKLLIEFFVYCKLIAVFFLYLELFS